MKVKIQVVTITDADRESICEVACVERHDHTPATLGLTLAEGKTLLQAIQEVVMEWQMQEYLRRQRDCPQYGKVRRSKEAHSTVFCTVFSVLPVHSPRPTHCSVSGACDPEIQSPGRFPANMATTSLTPVGN